MAEKGDPRVGSIVAERYRILERMASGGMGVVYRAERVELGRSVAVKFLHPSFARNREFLERFGKEARLMGRLDHPNCVSVIDFGVDDGAFIVMDFVTGQSLSELIGDGRVPPPRAIAIATQILAGLAHARERGIVHRDIKPANVMLARVAGTGDHVRILDFGLARLVDADKSQSGMVVGTPNYMSPEQASMGTVDGRADIYATGLVLYELLTARRVFVADEPLEVLEKHRSAPAPTLAEQCPEQAFSAALEAAIARALSKSPGDRFQTPEEFSEALARTPEARMRDPSGDSLSPAQVAASVPTAADGRDRAPRERPPRSRFLRRAAAVAVVAGAVGALTVGDGWDRARRWLTGQTERGAAWVGRTVEAAQRSAESKTEAPRPPEQVSVEATVEAAERLAVAGDREAAIRVLHRVRASDPRNARASLVLGNLYQEKGWTLEALTAWSEALRRNPRYASERQVNERVVAALANPKARNKARAIVLRQLRASARPALRAALSKPRTAPHARQLLEQLAAEQTGLGK